MYDRQVMLRRVMGMQMVNTKDKEGMKEENESGGMTLNKVGGRRAAI